MKIGVVGMGYVGLTLSIVAALKNHTVYGVERDKKIRDCIRSGKAHFFEPGLDLLLKDLVGTKLKVSDCLPSERIDLFIITVGTPLRDGLNEPNLDHILSALSALREAYDGSQLIILRSTIPVGTTRNVVLPYLSKLTGVAENDLNVAFCPERTIEGRAVSELQDLPQIIGGNNPRSLEMAEDFFSDITQTVIKVESLEAAELVKLFNNTYRDIHFALGNVFSEIAQQYQIDGCKVINAANKGYERSRISMPGFVGGPCLEKDPYILTSNLKNSPAKDFVISARKFNESLEDKVINWAILNSKDSKSLQNICVSGLAFKGIPETSDMRGSNSVNIAKKLVENGAALRLHDFIVSEREINELGFGVYNESIYSAAKGSSILLILNNNVKYGSVDVEKLLSCMSPDGLVLDAWGALNIKNFNATNRKIWTLGTLDIL